MVFQINPSFPTVWRTPHCLQIGIDSAAATLTPASVFEERMIAALTRGISRGGLDIIAKECHAPAHAVDDILNQLAPVLMSDDKPPSRPATRVVIDGTGKTSEHIRVFLTAAGCTIVATTPSTSLSSSADHDAYRDDTIDAAVIVSHFVVEPARHHPWLRRDIPHLAVVFSDQTVSIGPFVEPGVGPCLNCSDRYRTDHDSSWPAIASQLVGRTTEHDTDHVAWHTAMLVARAVWDTVVMGEKTLGASRIRFHPTTRSVTREACLPHPSCGCQSLEEIATSCAA